MDGKKISVIIADDNKEFCSILNDYLLNQRDIVVTGIAKDGREALTLIEERQPDLVVLDIIMPHFRKIKFNEFRKIPKNSCFISSWTR